MEENDIHEPEVVEESRELARPSVPTTINELAAHDKGVAIVEQRLQIFNTMRIASIQLTMPNDWTLFRTDDGRISGYLGDQGCDRIKKLWGISVSNLGKMERIDDLERAGEFAYRITGDGSCGLTGEAVFEMEGVRYSTERYALEKPEGIQRTVAVQKAARANLDGGITRELAGLKSVPSEELESAWKASKETWKKIDLCNKGRGFGSGAERKGAQVQQSDEIPVQFQPKCDQCQGLMKLVPAGKSQSGRPYDAFWGCAKDRTHKPTIPHAQATVEARRLQAEAAAATARQPGEEG